MNDLIGILQVLFVVGTCAIIVIFLLSLLMIVPLVREANWQCRHKIGRVSELISKRQSDLVMYSRNYADYTSPMLESDIIEGYAMYQITRTMSFKLFQLSRCILYTLTVDLIAMMSSNIYDDTFSSKVKNGVLPWKAK